MVVTIEPGTFVVASPVDQLMNYDVQLGIYVPPSPLFPKEFHDIGIRIEVSIDLLLLLWSVVRSILFSTRMKFSSGKSILRCSASTHLRRFVVSFAFTASDHSFASSQIADIEGACKGVLGLEPY